MLTIRPTRACSFHFAYIAESQKLSDERYLLEKCKDPEFYSNIRQHTGICTEVAENAKASVVLKALNVMAQSAHLCGGSSCADTLRLFLSRSDFLFLSSCFYLFCPSHLPTEPGSRGRP